MNHSLLKRRPGQAKGAKIKRMMKIQNALNPKRTAIITSVFFCIWSLNYMELWKNNDLRLIFKNWWLVDQFPDQPIFYQSLNGWRKSYFFVQKCLIRTGNRLHCYYIRQIDSYYLIWRDFRRTGGQGGGQKGGKGHILLWKGDKTSFFTT